MTSLRKLLDIPDPEGRFYIARELARLGEHAEALEILSSCIAGGFYCLPAFARDPLLDSLRALPEFGHILRSAEQRHRQALIAFLNAEGDRILGVAHPV